MLIASMEVGLARKYPEGEFESEREFLDAYDVSAFERPSVSVDVVIVTVTHW